MAKERRLGRGIEALLRGVDLPEVEYTSGNLPGVGNASGVKPNTLPAAGERPSDGFNVMVNSVSHSAETVSGRDLPPRVSPISGKKKTEYPHGEYSEVPSGKGTSSEKKNGFSSVASVSPSSEVLPERENVSLAEEKAGSASLGMSDVTHDVVEKLVVTAHAKSGDEEEFTVISVAIQEIDANPWQPREDFSAADLQSLAESLKTHGLIQPVVVRLLEGRYQLIAGERRLRAAERAGWDTIPAVVVEASDREMAELALIENLQRKDLNAVEKAQSFQRYLEIHRCKQEDLARRLNLDRATVSNFIRLLELPLEVQDLIRRGEITQGHARALLPLGDDGNQVEMCDRIMKEKLSVRQVEEMVKEFHQTGLKKVTHIPTPGKFARKKTSDPQTSALEQRLRSAVGLKVKLSHKSGGNGKLEVYFRNHEEFQRLMDFLCAQIEEVPPRKPKKVA